ncbi:MAG TPA: hypothetical protein VKB71_05320 [Rhizomicrobium sp.]|nr:hypothetical protein [Rhizomicrobium sp.]
MSSASLAFVDALCADRPADDRAKDMMLYGQFLGSWDGTVVVHRANGERFESSAEVHFGWALQGRAIQDVWIVPARHGRAAGEGDRMYGTTLRIFDPREEHWNILFIDPVRQSYDRMIGKKVGDDIVQEYRGAGGEIVQWCFTEIKGDSFHWLARESQDERKTWRVTGEYFLKRRKRPGEDTSLSAEERAFDFWRGVWRVTDPETGKELGTSRVDAILGERVLHENWSGLDGYRGESFNLFDRDRKCWHQSWVSDNGTLLLLDGGMRDGAMDLRGLAPDGDLHRIRWTPNKDGSVLQFWDASTDNGKTWTKRFAGLYRAV